MSLSSSVMDMDHHPKDEPMPLWRTNIPFNLGTLLWTNSKYKDFQIVIGDRVIRVHKCVLASRSPVFLAMFQSGLTEAQTGQLVIQDFDYDTVQNAIWILYSHLFATNYSSPVICDLLRFGHKYDIMYLINTCIHRIGNLVDIYHSSEKKLLIKSANELGSVQILKSIQDIFEKKGSSSSSNAYSPIPIGLALVQDDSFKDLKILCNDQEFSVHKCFLSLRSPVFAQMLTKMAHVGDTSGRLTITGFKPNIVENAIHFLYTEITLIKMFKSDLFLGILEFADKFGVEKLVRFCLKNIDNFKKSLDKEMVSTYIRTAANFESKEILDFLLAIFGTQGFEPLDFKKVSE